MSLTSLNSSSVSSSNDGEKKSLRRLTLLWLNGWPRCQNTVCTSVTTGHLLSDVRYVVKWSPEIEDSIVANQATTVFSTYYLLHILVYQPFITPSSPPSGSSKANVPRPYELPFPSSTICINAAKACARIVEGQLPRGFSNVPLLVGMAHVCGAVLLAQVWDLKGQQKAQQAGLIEETKPPLSLRIDELMADVMIFVDALEWAALRWEIAAEMLYVCSQPICKYTDY